MKRTQTRRLTLAAMMGAVSFVLMYFSFSVPVLSPFADFDLSGLPDLIGGFILGPVGAVEIIAVKVLLKLVFKGTSSMFTGEVQKFLLCTAYALPAVLYYQKHRTKRGAAIGLVLAPIAISSASGVGPATPDGNQFSRWIAIITVAPAKPFSPASCWPLALVSSQTRSPIAAPW